MSGMSLLGVATLSLACLAVVRSVRSDNNILPAQPPASTQTTSHGNSVLDHDGLSNIPPTFPADLVPLACSLPGLWELETDDHAHEASAPPLQFRLAVVNTAGYNSPGHANVAVFPEDSHTVEAIGWTHAVGDVASVLDYNPVWLSLSTGGLFDDPYERLRSAKASARLDLHMFSAASNGPLILNGHKSAEVTSNCAVLKWENGDVWNRRDLPSPFYKYLYRYLVFPWYRIVISLLGGRTLDHFGLLGKSAYVAATVWLLSWLWTFTWRLVLGVAAVCWSQLQAARNVTRQTVFDTFLGVSHAFIRTFFVLLCFWASSSTDPWCQGHFEGAAEERRSSVGMLVLLFIAALLVYVVMDTVLPWVFAGLPHFYSDLRLRGSRTLPDAKADETTWQRGVALFMFIVAKLLCFGLAVLCLAITRRPLPVSLAVAWTTWIQPTFSVVFGRSDPAIDSSPLPCPQQQTVLQLVILAIILTATHIPLSRKAFIDVLVRTRITKYPPDPSISATLAHSPFMNCASLGVPLWHLFMPALLYLLCVALASVWPQAMGTSCLLYQKPVMDVLWTFGRSVMESAILLSPGLYVLLVPISNAHQPEDNAQQVRIDPSGFFFANFMWALSVTAMLLYYLHWSVLAYMLWFALATVLSTGDPMGLFHHLGNWGCLDEPQKTCRQVSYILHFLVMVLALYILPLGHTYQWVLVFPTALSAVYSSANGTAAVAAFLGGIWTFAVNYVSTSALQGGPLNLRRLPIDSQLHLFATIFLVFAAIRVALWHSATGVTAVLFYVKLVQMVPYLFGFIRLPNAFPAPNPADQGRQAEKSRRTAEARVANEAYLIIKVFEIHLFHILFSLMHVCSG